MSAYFPQWGQLVQLVQLDSVPQQSCLPSEKFL